MNVASTVLWIDVAVRASWGKRAAGVFVDPYRALRVERARRLLGFGNGSTGIARGATR